MNLFKRTKEEWQGFYLAVFGWNVDFSELPVSGPPTGFLNPFLLIIPQGMTAELAYNKCAELFPCEKDYHYEDKSFDEAILTNSRDADKGTYAVWVRGSQEPEEIHLGKSAPQLLAERIAGITFLERLIFELKYHWDTGEHLDQHGRTLCPGSTDVEKFNFQVMWAGFGDNKKMKVGYVEFGYRSDNLGTREVVVS